MNVILMFVATLIAFFLFYFNVPYWTGKEMRDVAKNGLYRCFYMILSSIGWYIYKGIESLNRKLDNILRIRHDGVMHAVINLLIYIGVVFIMSNTYDYIMESVIGGEVNELKVMDSGSYARLSDLLLFWGILNNFTDVNSLSSFWVAIRESISSIVIFIIGTIMFFSVMFGLLSQKVQELCLIERVSHGGSLEEILNYEPESLSIKTLPKQILASVLDFCNKLSLVRNLKLLGVQFTFCVIVVCYSVMKTISGEIPDFYGIALDLLDETGVVATIGSFVISFVVAKGVAIVGKLLGKFLPVIIQEKLHQLSDRGNQLVQAIKERRDAWSSEFDEVYRRTQQWRGVFVPVKEMHLD